MAIVKSNFTLILDDGRRFEFAAGEQEIPGELADHWYVKAHCEQHPEVYDAPEVVADAEPADAPVDPDPVFNEPEEERRRPGRPKKS